MLPTKLWFIWPSGFRGEDFYKLTNHKQELPVVAIFVIGLGRNSKHGRHRQFLFLIGRFLKQLFL
jgi:hypothetical protein